MIIQANINRWIFWKIELFGSRSIGKPSMIIVREGKEEKSNLKAKIVAENIKEVEENLEK